MAYPANSYSLQTILYIWILRTFSQLTFLYLFIGLINIYLFIYLFIYLWLIAIDWLIDYIHRNWQRLSPMSLQIRDNLPSVVQFQFTPRYKLVSLSVYL